MANLSSLIFGWFFIIGGLALTIAAFFSFLIMLVYGLPILAIGIYMIFNKWEDKIEQRKDIKRKRHKK